VGWEISIEIVWPVAGTNSAITLIAKTTAAAVCLKAATSH
jgi:hypothetical protein